MGGEQDSVRAEWIEAQRELLGRLFSGVRGMRHETQEQVADRAGMSRSTYNKVEKGTANPELETLLKIAFALDLPIADHLSLALPGVLKESRTKLR